MLKVVPWIAGAFVVLVAALQSWRWMDLRAADGAWERLAAMRTDLPARFDPEMGGQLALGPKEKPQYQPMRAHQVLVPPHGFVVAPRCGARAHAPHRLGWHGVRSSWVRFWLMAAAPVVRAGGSPDHLRAAFGRVVAEAAFWAPAALLPQSGVAWEAVDADTARATMTHRGMTQSVDIRVDEDGRPQWVMIQRWTDSNPDRQFRLQPFGGHLADFREVAGYRLPFRVEGGNFFGTDEYFPFYKAEVEAIRVLVNAAAR